MNPGTPQPETPQPAPRLTWRRRLVCWIRDNRGTAAVSFILCLPIFLTIVGIFLQYALLANARNVVGAAAGRVARTAVTALPEERYDAINRAAYIVLANLSPAAKDGVDPEAVDVQDALTRAGIYVSNDFAQRYTYAKQATQIDYPNLDYRHSRGQAIEITVRYRYYLTVPGAMALLGDDADTVAGITGRFHTMVSTIRIETAHGREARAGSDGWPN